MKSLTSNNNRRVAKNALFLYIRMFFALVVNLYTSRVLLHSLGVDDYGVYNVVAGFVSLFGFLNATLSSSVQRFYNYEGTKKASDGFRNVYVISLYTHAIISVIVIILLETVGLWYVNNVLVVPADRLNAANWLFQTTSISLIMMTMQIPYVGAVMAKENMDFYAVVSIVDVLLKLIVAVFISKETVHDRLIVYGLLLMIVSALDLLIYVIYCRYRFCEMRLRLSFDRKLFSSMLSFSGWNLIGTFAFMLKGQGINMLLNYFFGPIVNAARGIAFQINGAVSGFSSSVYTAFGPQVVKSYAEGNTSRTIRLMFSESKICFSLIAVILVPAILEIGYLLNLWLGGIVPENSDLFSSLVLVDTLICTLNTPCTQVVQATGKIKLYQICSTIVNICLIPFAWIFLKYGASAKSAFICTIIISCVNQLVCVMVTNRQIGFGLRYYLKKIILPCLFFVALLPICPSVIHALLPVSFLRFFLVCLVSACIGVLLVYFVMLGNDERTFIKNIVTTKFKI